MKSPDTSILFLCTGNSCRSQMAEGWTRVLQKDDFQAFSAGVRKSSLDPLAVRVMSEAGVDISRQTSKLIEELPDMQFDYVITLCGHARENCPLFFTMAQKIHRGFDDPPFLARKAATEEEALEHYRRVRDEIKAFVQSFPHGLTAIDH
ncbi:arsenate reductase ArsC [Desulfonatronospira sp.]|uniref:arsenate reductase ArsC n=1 Tax=Desulfonatronospira sp. TaxID=1962951 RepID=UPI0025C51ED8|nr:arsenate reductase ArsC [Desulfonatronospira sp.]